MAKLGETLSEETRRKIGDARRGEKHPMFGKHHTEEARKKISVYNRNRPPISEETRKRLSDSHKGNRPTKETLKKMSESHIGISPSEETLAKMSESRKGEKHSDDWNRKVSNAKIGTRMSLETRLKMSQSHLALTGGVSFEPYCPRFNNEFKERVRAFFGYVCQLCGKPQGGEKLHIHHVNFDKMTCCNDVKPLFVPLCRSCHPKTNFNRGRWEQHFTEAIMTKFGGQCYEVKA